MTAADRLYRWNRWYDQLPEVWRFQVVLWPLVAVGFFNMLLTIFVRFSFGLLVFLALLCFAAIRVPYVLGWITPGATAQSERPSAARFEVANADWLVNLNQRYDAMPEFRGIWLVTGILLIAGVINMVLTIGTGFPFGLIFLLAILALLGLRAPYVAGFLTSPGTDHRLVRVSHDEPEIARSPSPSIQADDYSAATTMPAPAAPSEMRAPDSGDAAAS